MDLLTLAMAKAYSDKKGGYTEIANTVLLDGVFEVPEVEGGPSLFECECLEIKTGDNVTVKWNGVQYTCVVFDGEGNVGFGNLAVMGAESNTGEPFLFGNVVYEDGTSAGVFATYDRGSITVTVKRVTEIVYPIDPKYLVKTIDLDKYGIGEVIIGLVMQEGGYTELDTPQEFWDELRADVGKDFHLKMVFQGSTIDISGITRIISEYGFCEQVCFNFLVASDLGVGKVSVSIVYGAKLSTVHVTIG